MKLELGAGQRPTRGYTHHDQYQFPHIEIIDDPWMIDLPDESLDEVLAVAFIEHLTHDQACDTFRNVHRMLKPGGLFLFDVPNYPVWVGYYLRQLNSKSGDDYTDIPPMDHVRRTLFGWGRWPGDSHLYGWDSEHLAATLCECGFSSGISPGNVDEFKARTFRARFDKPEDAHLYVVAWK